MTTTLFRKLKTRKSFSLSFAIKGRLKLGSRFWFAFRFSDDLSRLKIHPLKYNYTIPRPHTMPVKIQTRPVNQNVLDDLLTAGADPLIARLCASRDVQSPAELDDKLAGLLPYQSLINCEAAARRLADAIERKEKIFSAWSKCT